MIQSKTLLFMEVGMKVLPTGPFPGSGSSLLSFLDVGLDGPGQSSHKTEVVKDAVLSFRLVRGGKLSGQCIRFTFLEPVGQ